MVGHRLHLRWECIRPFPLPRYIAGTPRTGSPHPLDPCFPPNALTLAAAALSEEAWSFVTALLGKLTPMEEVTEQQVFYDWSKAKFGRHWRHANLLTALWAAATFIQPSTYLEIGVYRGRSAAVVGSVRPQCDIYGFDLWIPDYAGTPNPGPDFVRQELRAVGHTGNVTLISGDSRKTVSVFLRQHPNLYFDLITIDGDHSLLGAANDLANALPRLKVGGILVFDDIRMAPHLTRVWKNVIKRDSCYLAWEFTEAGVGVAAAIRISDEPPLASLA